MPLDPVIGLFWASLALIAYTYLVYPFLLLTLTALKNFLGTLRFLLHRTGRRIGDRSATSDLPTVSILVAARNEEAVLLQKLKNFAEVDYPAEKIELLIGSDSSTDRTVEIANRSGDKRVRVFDFRDRAGKIGTLHKLLEQAKSDLIVLGDANTFLRPNAVRMMARHFEDPNVGAVCGELRLEAPDGTLQTEGAYWRYETAIKMLESGFDAVLGANGGLYAVRRHLFPRIPPDTIVEDFVIPLKIRERGFRTPYEPEAIAIERNPVDPKGEFRRRVRIGTGCAQSIPLVWGLLHPRFGMVALALLSHKMIRWLVPFAMITVLISNLFLIHRPLFLAFLVAQAFFYGAAALGSLLHRLGRRPGLLGIAHMFVTLNGALGIGFFKYFLGQHQVAWDRTARTPQA